MGIEHTKQIYDFSVYFSCFVFFFLLCSIQQLPKVWLFFGCRTEALDLYCDEKQEMVEKKILDRVFLALSREPNVPKVWLLTETINSSVYFANLLCCTLCVIYLLKQTFFDSGFHSMWQFINFTFIFYSILFHFCFAFANLTIKPNNQNDDGWMVNRRLTYKTWQPKRRKTFMG